MEDNKLNSKEFTELVGISLKKLEKMEKEGKITPVREGRIRYYYNEQVKQFEQAEGRYVLGIDVPRDKIFSLIYKEESKDVLDMLEYCLSHNVKIDDNIIVKEDDVIKGLEKAIDVISNPTIEILYYNGKKSVWPIIEEESKKHGVKAIWISEPTTETKRWSIRGLINNVRRKEDGRDIS